MEIMAEIAGLKALNRRCRVTVWSDSEYLVKAMNEGWVRNWKRHEWIMPNRKSAGDIDLWDRLLELCDKNIVKFEYFKNHTSNKQSAYCNEIANRAARNNQLLEDVGFQQRRKVIKHKTSEKKIKDRPVGAVNCPICSGSGHIMVKAGPLSHKPTIKIMCSSCIGTGYFRKIMEQYKSLIDIDLNITLFQVDFASLAINERVVL
jgi:ribonuclease HI